MTKGIKRLAIGLALMVGVVGIGFWLMLRSSMPITHGVLKANKGLQAPVSVSFDSDARPFVQASTMSDAFFAQGWLHAQNRLWQMELFRRAATARLAELFGEDALESDKDLYRIGVPQLAKRLQAMSDPETDALIAAYVKGVNAGIADFSTLPPEFLLLSAEPKAWTKSDVYAMGALLAYQSANNYRRELLRLAVGQKLGMDALEVFRAGDSNSESFPYVLKPEQSLAPAVAALANTDPIDKDLFPSLAFGSNGWVVAPEKSTTGNALFAFDSHDALGLPNLFYEVHLFFEEGKQIRGWSVAGMPGVINGYNENIAWGFTNIGDTQDLFVETRHPDNPLMFKLGEEWVEGRSESFDIPVKGKASEPFTVNYSHNGPLISGEPAISLAWTVHRAKTYSLSSLFALNRAENWDEFTGALDHFLAPTLNATYADRHGDIGFRTGGVLPKRGAGEGLVPLDGSRPENLWQGLVPASEMPERKNPSAGYLAAANARVNALGDGVLVSADNAPGYRIKRIQSVLESKEKISPTDMQVLQLDWYDGQAALLLPTLLAEIMSNDLSEREQKALNTLRSWDYMSLPVMAEPIIYQAWYRSLAYQVFEPALGADLFKRFIKDSYLVNQTLDGLILRHIDHALWRDARSDIITEAYKTAIAEISTQLGEDVNAWQLKDIQYVSLQHELSKAVPELGILFDAPHYPWGGSLNAVGRARYRLDNPFVVNTGATVRVVGDMSDEPFLMATIPGGQSGHPLSETYTNQVDAWLYGVLLSIDPEKARQSLTLVP